MSSRHAWLFIYSLSHVLVSSHGAAAAVCPERGSVAQPLLFHLTQGGEDSAITMEKLLANTQWRADQWDLSTFISL